MKKMKINVIEYSLLMMVLITTFLKIGIINEMFEISSIDTWISVIIGSVIGYIVILMFFKIQSYNNKLDINKINISLFGNILGKTINIVLIIYSLTIVSLLLYSIVDYTSIKILDSSYNIIIKSIFILLCVFTITKNFEVFFRASSILSFLAFIFISLIIIILFKNSNINNLMPVLHTNKLINILNSSFLYVTNVITPTFLLLLIPRDKLMDRFNYKKVFTISYIITSIIVFLNVFLIISILGIDLTLLYERPEIVVLNKITTFSIFGRMDSILSFDTVILIFISTTYLLFYAYRSIISNFKINIRNNMMVLSLVSILSVILSSLIINKNTIKGFLCIYNCISFGIFLLFLFIFINTLIKKNNN